MEMRTFGKGKFKVTPMTLGCWAAGGGKEWGKKLDDEIYLDMMTAAIDKGINFLDSAAFYGLGHSEELIGQAIKGYPREKLVISSKQVAQRLTKDKARETVEACLNKLGTDYVDIFLVHWPSPDVEIGENIEALEALKEEGLIRGIGVSNYTIKHLERAVKYGTIDIVQPCYSLFWRHIEKDILPFCREHDIGIMTYASIGQGLLTGKFAPDHEFASTDQRPQVVPLYSKEVFPVAYEAAQKIASIGAKYGKTCAQTAINWVYNTPGITTAIVGAVTRAQVEENIGALGWTLSEEDRKTIGDYGRVVYDMVADWDTLFGKDHPALKLKD